MTCAPNELVARGTVGMLADFADITSLGWAVSPAGEFSAESVGPWLALEPDVVVLSGVGADSRWLLERVPAVLAARASIRVLALVWAARPGWIAELAAVGVAGIADLGVTAAQLGGAVRALAAGQDWVSPAVAQELGRQQRELDAGRGIEHLSQREWQVLAELARGGDNATIAARLGISVHTAAGHVHAVCTKLHATNRLQAAVIAIRLGLVAL
jgi:DNA-binding NarL/FixJ family response regulator